MGMDSYGKYVSWLNFKTLANMLGYKSWELLI